MTPFSPFSALLVLSLSLPLCRLRRRRFFTDADTVEINYGTTLLQGLGRSPAWEAPQIRLLLPSSSSPSSSVVVTSANAAVFAPNITRSITVIRTPPSSAASSPRGASVPSSRPPPGVPLCIADAERELEEPAEETDDADDGGGGSREGGPRSPNVYDWMVISSLDR
uniref:Uncharacterized protein n=1 Tax=Ananas comosus var. bracteatus TaxID=296719 RepID=A0A6V7P3R2_ANACO|nr:unnamed protein product [Ananas comosus var. bracteatus]